MSEKRYVIPCLELLVVGKFSKDDYPEMTKDEKIHIIKGILEDEKIEKQSCFDLWELVDAHEDEIPIDKELFVELSKDGVFQQKYSEIFYSCFGLEDYSNQEVMEIAAKCFVGGRKYGNDKETEIDDYMNAIADSCKGSFIASHADKYAQAVMVMFVLDGIREDDFSIFCLDPNVCENEEKLMVINTKKFYSKEVWDNLIDYFKIMENVEPEAAEIAIKKLKEIEESNLNG